MEKPQIKISEEEVREIEKFYGKSDEETVSIVISDILNRYLNVEHFDPELKIEDKDF